MRNFPWLEAALFIALAFALIVKPQNKQASAATSASSTSIILPTSR